MPDFRTKIAPQKFPFEISHSDKIISIGSCFSENIGQKLADLKFDISINPYGILFNPISIFNSINEIIEQKEYTENDLIKNQENWFSFNHHSSFSSLDKKEVLNKINNSINDSYNQIKSSKVLFITFGTSWVYHLNETKKVVANCYKLPANLFIKELLSVSEIVSEFEVIIAKIKAINPTIQIINTISPVRHWKDGVTENQQSKATLFLALKEITEKYTNCHYFPSYEIMMDDLRDYRFYEKDMLHPSPIAIDYIWNKLENSIFNSKTIELNKKITKLKTAVNHKTFNPKSEETKRFKTKTLEQIIALEKEFDLDFEVEKSKL